MDFFGQISPSKPFEIFGTVIALAYKSMENVCSSQTNAKKHFSVMIGVYIYNSIQEIDHIGGPSVIIWSGISIVGKTVLVVFDCTALHKGIHQASCDLICTAGGSHSSVIVCVSGQVADLNRIVLRWLQLNRRVRDAYGMNTVKRAWEEILAGNVARLIDIMYFRLQACVAKRGG